jgi:hypothetical protein
VFTCHLPDLPASLSLLHSKKNFRTIHSNKSAGIYLVFRILYKPKSMKTFLISAALVALCGCAARKEVQVQMVNARLVKVDTVYRFNTDPQKQLTWKDENEIEYVTFASLGTSYPIGTRMMVLIRR